MPFGSMNAPSTFQRLMDRVLNGLTWRQCLVYIDDILIFSKTFENHLKDIEDVLQRLVKSNIKLRVDKCSFVKLEINYLGFKLSEKGVQPTSDKVDAILKIRPPNTANRLNSFLCAINYYRHLIPNFGEITVGLYDLCKGKRQLEWSDQNLEQFQLLKRSLITVPILSFPNFEKPFLIR